FTVDNHGRKSLDGAFVVHFKVNTDVLVVLLNGDNARPPVTGKVVSDFLGALFQLRAVFIIQADYVDLHQLETIKQLRDFRLVLGDDLGRKIDKGSWDIHFDELTTALRRRKTAEIHLAG